MGCKNGLGWRLGGEARTGMDFGAGVSEFWGVGLVPIVPRGDANSENLWLLSASDRHCDSDPIRIDRGSCLLEFAFRIDCSSGPWVWAVVGAFASFWVQWGVIHSDLTRHVTGSFRGSDFNSSDLNRSNLHREEELPPRGDTSSAVVLSWLIGLCAAVVFAWGVWLLAENRVPLLVLLGVAGVSQSVLGWRAENGRALALGVFVCILAATFGIEGLGLSDSAMRWSDWFSWQRVLAFIALGGTSLGVGVSLARNSQTVIAQLGAKRLGVGGLGKGRVAQ